MRALYDASQLHLGFTGDNVLTFELAPVKGHYPDAASMQGLSQRLLPRLQAIPGVTGASVTTNLPASSDIYGQFQSGMHTPEGKKFVSQYHGIGPGFLALFSIRLREGRDFTRADVRGGERVAIVSQDLADAYYGGDAVGRTVIVESDDGPGWPTRIVGVVGETYQRGPLQPKQPMMYVPLAQVPDPMMLIFRNLEPLRFVLRGQGNPLDWSADVRQAVAEIAPEQPIANLRSMHSIVQQTTANARLSLLLISLLASLALLLAAAGLYAVMAVAVAAREREFGVRAALGARPAGLVRLILRAGLIQVVVGLVIGVGIALGISRPLSALLMLLLGRTSAFDPLAVLGVCVALAAAGLLACLLPALRAGRVHPMRALRGE
jgi:putative ABC transport system permease protein